MQRRDDYIQELKEERSDYCEPWDSTIKTDNTNVSSKKSSNSDEEKNEYLDPYDTGKVGKMDKRLSRGVGKDFGVHHGRNVSNEQRRSGIEVDPKHPAFEQRFVTEQFANLLYSFQVNAFKLIFLICILQQNCI